MTQGWLGIAGSAGTLNGTNDSYGSGLRGARAVGRPPSRASPPPGGGARGNLGESTRQDIANWEIYYKEKYYGGKYNVKTTTLTKNGESMPKSMVMTAIRNLFNAGHEKCHITYAGHGSSGNGDWCFEDGSGNCVDSITLTEIAGLWSSRSNSVAASLHISMDSCYSGEWVHQQHIQQYPAINVSSACGRTELAYYAAQGGNYSRAWKQHDYLMPQHRDYQVIQDDQHPLQVLWQGAGKTVLLGAGHDACFT